MADLSVTAGSVLASSSAKTRKGIAGATITAGQTLYEDTSALDASGKPKLKLADSDDASAVVRNCCGIALNGASAGQPVVFVEEDPSFTPGASLVVGTTYVLSDTAGGIMPAADLEIGDYPTVLFIANTTALATLRMCKGTGAIAA